MRMYLGLAVLLLGAPLHPAASGPKKRIRAASEEHPSADVMALEEEFVEEETAEPVTTKRHLASASAISLNQAMLEDVAQGFGYKTANLQALETICSAFNKATSTPITVAVPSFIGIPSHALQQALLPKPVVPATGLWGALSTFASAVTAKITSYTSTPPLPVVPYYFNIQEEWAHVVNSITAEEIHAALTIKQFPAAFITACEAFKQRFSDHWARFVTQTATKPLDGTFGFAGLDRFVVLIAEREALLMVRSTGKEDTKACANAGGNKSIACVAPNRRALLIAIGKVIKSYFSLKSLTQRLRLGDQTVFSPDVFTPVLLQQMIGEKSGKAIPRCGVMFTEDPEGHNPLNPTQTTGITLIQAAYGHNEGVVNSLIPVDSYYAIQLATQATPAIYPVVRKKTARLVPATSGSTALVRKNNPQKLQLHRALSEIELATLKAFADALEQYYGYAMDVEFVVMGDTIFIVQARPIVHKAMHAPSYLQHDIPGTHFTGSTIGAAGGSVCIIEHPAEAIMAPSINAALNEYLFNSEINPAAIKAIIIGEQAASTSHAATVFRNAGKPVIFLPQWPALVTELSSGKKILLSVQQNTAVATDAIDLSDLIKPGWITYPAPRCISALPNLFGSNATSGGTGAGAGAGSGAAYGTTATTADALKIPLARLIGIMKTETPTKVHTATQSLLEKWRHYAATKTLDRGLATDREQLEASLQAISNHVNGLAPVQPSEQYFMQRLLAVRMLEALTFQQFPSDEILQPLSMATLGKILKQETDAAKIGPDAWACPEVTLPYYLQLKKVDTVIHAETVATAWQSILRTAASQPTAEHIRKLASIINKLTTMNVLPMWLHTTCYKNISEMGHENIAALLATWEADFASAKDFLAVTTEKQQLIREIKSNLTVFDSPKTFAPAWQHFKEHLLDAFMSADFIANLKATTPLGKLVACATMHQLVDLNDEIIKTMKGSQAWGLAEKLATFKMTLEASFQILKAWTSLITEADVLKTQSFDASPISKFIEVIQTSLYGRTVFSINDLNASQGFDASAVTIGNATQLRYGYIKLPSTGEDVFMAIHQNQLALIAILHAKYGGLTAELPMLLKQTLKTLASISDRNCYGYIYSFNPIALNINKMSIEVTGNTPLREHSCKFTVTYTKNSIHQYVDIAMELFGNAEHSRWPDIAEAFIIQAALGDFTLSKVHTYEHGTSAIIRIVDEAPLTMLKNFIPDVLDRTLGTHQGILVYKDSALASLTDLVFLSKTVSAMEAFGSIGLRAALTILIRLTNPRDTSLVITSPLYNFMSDVAAHGTTSTDNITSRKAFELFKQLLRGGHGYQQALALANKAALSTDLYLKINALVLLIELVKQGQALSEALAIAQAKSVDADDFVKYHVLDLFSSLVEKEFGIEEAIMIASREDLAESTDYCIQSSFRNLVAALVKKGHCYELAQHIATKQPDSKRNSTLWTALVEQGQYLPQALTAAVANTTSNDYRDRDQALMLFSKLFEIGRGFEQALDAAKKCISGELDIYSIKHTGLDLFGLLVENGYYYEEAKTAAIAQSLVDDRMVIEHALKLFTHLVKKGQAIPEARHAAMAHKDKDGEVKNLQKTLDRLAPEAMESDG